MTGSLENNPCEGVSEFLAQMAPVCEQREFATGEALRIQGQHYRNMYLVVDGECAVQIKPGNRAAQLIVRGPGQPIGEIGFLRGTAANATVTAREPMRVLVVDNEAVDRLVAETPDIVADLMRKLSKIADDRTSYNLTLSDAADLDDKSARKVDVLLCQNPEMLTRAQRLRYEVYCEELGRNSPSADHGDKTIADALDEFAHCFIAMCGGEVIGTIRINFSDAGSLGLLETLYGMTQSPHHPDHNGICTKFIVKRAHRGGPTAMQLVSHATQFGIRHKKKECYIDCVPKLVHYYRAMGFKPSGETFLHPENGPSLPMRLDLDRYGKELVGEMGIRRMLKFYVKARAMKLSGKLKSGASAHT